jgi:hypothetical protein
MKARTGALKKNQVLMCGTIGGAASCPPFSRN